MNKQKTILTILILTIILISQFSSVFANSFYENSKINLIFDHDCISVLKMKGEDKLKGVAYVCYKDPNTGIKYPAFCVEPENKGVGSGAGNSYDVKLSQLNNPILWRMLYKGYVGTSYKDWNLECDDDLYYATKTATHCFAYGTSPKAKYEVPTTRVGKGENVSLEEVQRRGAKVLEAAQKIYDYGMNGKENFVRATINLNKGKEEEQILKNTKYLIQNDSISANKELKSYSISVSNFPTGTKILNSSNTEVKTQSDTKFKIAIPVNKITENIFGQINISNAQVKSYPVFYCSSGNSKTQDYIISGVDESISTNVVLKIDAYKSSIKIVKVNDESKPVQGTIFNLKYEDGTNIGNYTTDKNGEIQVSKLKQGNVIATEISTPEQYILNEKSHNVKIEYNSTSNMNMVNNYKRGNFKIIKVDKDNNEIKIPGIKFQVLDSSYNIIGEYTTDENGEINAENLKIGNYYIREIKEDTGYYPLEEDIEIIVKYNETALQIIENEKIPEEPTPEEPTPEVPKTPDVPKLPRTGF